MNLACNDDNSISEYTWADSKNRWVWRPAGQRSHVSRLPALFQHWWHDRTFYTNYDRVHQTEQTHYAATSSSLLVASCSCTMARTAIRWHRWQVWNWLRIWLATIITDVLCTSIIIWLEHLNNSTIHQATCFAFISVALFIHPDYQKVWLK